MIKTAPALIPRIQGFSIVTRLEYGHLSNQPEWLEKVEPDFLECTIVCTGEVEDYPMTGHWHVLIFQAKQPIRPTCSVSEESRSCITFLQPSEELVDIKMEEYGASPHGYGAWVVVTYACHSCKRKSSHRFFLTKRQFPGIPLSE